MGLRRARIATHSTLLFALVAILVLFMFAATASAAETQSQAGQGAGVKNVIIMIADASYEVVTTALGLLRLHLAERMDLIPVSTFSPLWVTDFPLFTATPEGITSSHHPFTSPDRMDFDPADVEGLLSLRSRAYDVVVNGEELGGGSIRIHDRGVQRKIFRALGLSDTEVEEKFGFFLRALGFGAPPHGGIALGMDRACAMILGTSSIREVIAFPKNRSAFCPLTQAPSDVSRDQLAELGLLDLGSTDRVKGMAQKKDLVDSLPWVSRIGIADNERTAIGAGLGEANRLAAVVDERAGDEAPLYSVTGTVNRMRKAGEAQEASPPEQEAIFKNAPAMKGKYFKVASILE